MMDRSNSPHLRGAPPLPAMVRSSARLCHPLGPKVTQLTLGLGDKAGMKTFALHVIASILILNTAAGSAPHFQH